MRGGVGRFRCSSPALLLCVTLTLYDGWLSTLEAWAIFHRIHRLLNPPPPSCLPPSPCPFPPPSAYLFFPPTFTLISEISTTGVPWRLAENWSLGLVHFNSVQFKMVSVRAEKPICASPSLGSFPQRCFLKRFQCSSD